VTPGNPPRDYHNRIPQTSPAVFNNVILSIRIDMSGRLNLYHQKGDRLADGRLRQSLVPSPNRGSYPRHSTRWLGRNKPKWTGKNRQALVHRLANSLAFERRCSSESFVALLHHTQRYALSRAPQHGTAHRRSRCAKLFTRRYTKRSVSRADSINPVVPSMTGL
jgi:hypothetical protein